MASNLNFGIQAHAHWADIEGHGSCFDAGVLATVGLSFACNDKVSSFGTVTGRVGVAVDHALIYAKGVGLGRTANTARIRQPHLMSWVGLARRRA